MNPQTSPRAKAKEAMRQFNMTGDRKHLAEVRRILSFCQESDIATFINQNTFKP
jgi:hypothetical protein